MVKATASSSAVWKHVSVFVSLFWLTSILSVAFSERIELKILSTGTAQCGGNLALSCNANSSLTMSIKKFVWVKYMRNTSLCEYENDQTGIKDKCERKKDTSLILNLVNISRDDEGEYICKLHAREGMANANFSITIKACSGSRAVTTTPSGSSGRLVLSTCIAVGVVMVNLIMYS